VESKQLYVFAAVYMGYDDHHPDGDHREDCLVVYAAARQLSADRHYARRAPQNSGRLPDLQEARPRILVNSVGPDEYSRLYRAEILDPLDPRAVASELLNLAGGKIPALLCYERPGTGQWCHRAMAAEWLSEALGEAVPEFGFKDIAQADHPLLPPSAASRRAVDLFDWAAISG